MLIPAGAAAQLSPSHVVHGVSDTNRDVVLGAALTIEAHPDKSYANPAVVERLGALTVGSDLPLAAASGNALKAIGPAAGEHLPVEFWSWEPQKSDRDRVVAWFDILAATRPNAAVAVVHMLRIGSELLSRMDTPPVVLRAFSQLRGDPARLVRSTFDRSTAPNDRRAALRVLSTLPEDEHTFSLDEAHQLLNSPRKGLPRYHLMQLVAARTSTEPADIARLQTALKTHGYSPEGRFFYNIVASKPDLAGGLLCSARELRAAGVRQLLESTGYQPSMACVVIHLGESARATLPDVHPFGLSTDPQPVYDPTDSALALARMGQPGFAMLIRWYLEPFRGEATDVARKRQAAATRALADHPNVPWPVFDRLRQATRVERTDAEVRLMARFGARASPHLRDWASAGDARAMRELGRRDADLLIEAATNPEHPAHAAALVRAAELQLEPERLVRLLVVSADIEEWTPFLRRACRDACIRTLANLSVSAADKTRRNALRALGEILSGASDLSEPTRQAVTDAVRTNFKDRNYKRDAQRVASRLGRAAAPLVELLLEDLGNDRYGFVATALIHSGVARRHQAELLELSKRGKLGQGHVRVLAAIVDPTDVETMNLLRAKMESEDFTTRELAAEAVARHSTTPREILRARGLSWYAP